MSNRTRIQYSGRLSPKQVAEGCKMATRSAKRLAEDPKLLMESGRYLSAASLAVLSVFFGCNPAQ